MSDIDQHAQLDRANLVVFARALSRDCDWTRVRELAIRGWKVGVEARLAV